MSIEIKFKKLSNEQTWKIEGNTLKDGSKRNLSILDVYECQGLGSDGSKIMKCIDNLDSMIELINAILNNKGEIHTRAWHIAERINGED